MFQPKKWWIGLPLLVLIFLLAARNAETIESDIAGRVQAVLAKASRAIQNPQASVSGRDVSVSGLALSDKAKAEALSETARQEGVRSVIDATTSPGLAKPFIFELERNGRKITLSGHAPVSGERERLTKAIAARGEEVVDRSTYAAGAPSSFETLTSFGLAQLASLDPGKITLTDATVVVRGEAKTSADYEKLLAAAKSPPAGVVVTEFEVSAPRVSPFVWSAVKTGDAITLSGHVPSSDVRAFLATKTAGVAPNATVSDESRVTGGAPGGDFAGAAAFALAQLSKLTDGKAVLTDATLTIEGSGRENVAAATIRSDARSDLPRGFELSEVKVKAGKFSPYLFSAQKKDSKLTLSGYVPDEAAHTKIAASARSLGPDVVDEITVANGAPANFGGAVAAGLRALARLTEGKLDISDTKMELEGEAFHQSAATEIQASLGQSLPTGFESSARLTAKPVGEALDRAHCRRALAAILENGIAFRAPGAEIAPDSLPVVDAVAATVLRCPDVRIEISGHTDSSGAEEESLALSERRARAVLDRLIEAGADPARLTAAGFGGARPIASNDSESGRAQNRRLEFLIK